MTNHAIESILNKSPFVREYKSSV